AARLVGEHAPAPAVAGEHRLAHRLGVADDEVRAARVGEAQVEIAPFREALLGGADDLADEFDREARLRGFQQIQIPEVRDLHPALAALSHGDVEWILYG